jgi:AraC family cel operon transcriptional repressor
VRPNDIHDYITRDGKKFSMLNIAFSAKTAESLFEYLGSGFPSKKMIDSKAPPQAQLGEKDISYVISHMTSILAIDENEYESRQSSMRILIFRIFTRYFSDYKDELSDDMPMWLAKLCDEMRKNGNFTYGTARMLELTDKSREHLSRSIKKYMGVTPSEFINDLRLSFIASMLKSSNHKIADIVFESGFGNLSWASLLFKQKYGITMQEYRNGE